MVRKASAAGQSPELKSRARRLPEWNSLAAEIDYYLSASRANTSQTPCLKRPDMETD